MTVKFFLKRDLKVYFGLHGWTLTELAKKTGYTLQEVSMIVNQKREPSWQFLRKLTAVTGLTAEKIIETVIKK